MSSEIRGELRVGRIDELGTDRVVARHVALYDPSGTRVVVADEVVVVPDLQAALTGKLRFSSARLRNGTARLIEGAESTPTLIDAFEAVEPSPSDEPGLHAIVDDIQLERVTVYGEVLGLEGLRVENVTAGGRLEVDGPLVIRIDSTTGRIVRPFPFVGHLDDLAGTIHSDPAEGVRLEALAHKDGEQARVEMVYARPEGAPPAAAEELDLTIHADPIQARTVHELGYDWAELLTGELRGQLGLRGPPEDLRLAADLESDGGPVQVAGHLPSAGVVEIEARSTGVDLERLVGGAPAMHVAGRAALRVQEDEGAAPHVTVELDPFQIDGWAAPALTMEGRLEEDRVTIDRVTAPYAGGRVRGGGHVHFDGATNLHLSARVPQIGRDPNLRRLVPDARGELETNFRLVLGGEGRDYLRWEGTLKLRNFRYGPLAARLLVLEGRVQGDPNRPEVDLDVDGQDVTVADYPLGRADLLVRGGPSTYRTAGRFEAEGDRRVEFDATVRARGSRYELEAERIELVVAEQVWRGALSNAVLRPDREVVVERVVLASGSQRLEANGTVRFRGDDEIDVQLQDFDLAGLRAIVGEGAPEVAGRIDGHMELRGDVTDPALLLTGAWRDGAVLGLEGMNLAYMVNYAGGQVSLDGQLDLGQRGSVMAVLTGMVDLQAADPLEAFERGIYELEIAADELDLEVLRTLIGPDAPELGGRVGGRITASGPIQAPSFEGSLGVPALAIPGWPEVGVRSQFSYEQGVLNTRIQLDDHQGPLAETEASLVIDLVHLATDPAEGVASLETVPWRLSLRLPHRTLADYPEPLRELLPETWGPLDVSASATFQGGAFRTRGDVFAAVEWTDELAGRVCGSEARPRGTLTAKLRDDATTLHGNLMLGSRPALRVRAHAPTPIDRWLLAARVPEPPPLDVEAELTGMDATGIPVLCESVAGPVSGHVRLTGLFTDSPAAQVDLRSDAVQLRRYRRDRRRGMVLEVETSPLESTVQATLDAERLETNASIQWAAGGSTELEAHVPIAWGGDNALPTLGGDGRVRATLGLARTPIAPLLAWVPGIVNVDGSLTGDLRIEGPVVSPEAHGRLELEHGYLEIVPLGQQLSDLNGTLVFRGNWIEVEELRARDREGALTLRGGIDLDGAVPRSMRLELKAERFPVRQEASVLATLTGSALLDGSIDEDAADAHITIRELTVRMPDDPIRSVQELDVHPDVHVAGEERDRDGDGDPYPIRISLQARQPFWVRRTDLAAQVTTELQAVYSSPDLRVSGYVEIRRGFFEVFGKRFDVQAGRMNFLGDTEMNPDVSLVAVHELRSHPGETVTVAATGHLTRPEVTFSTSIPDCAERSQVIALLVGGQCGVERPIDQQQEQEAGQQAAGFLADIAAGVVTLAAREEFGEVIPVLVVERDRVRFGYQADTLIPEFLRPVIRGVYVEGFVATGASETSTGTTGTTARGGFLIEVQHPRNIVSNVTYAPPANWSLDFTWEP